ENATTDVWAHGRFAYTGTFNSPCGGEPEAGIWVWDVRNKNRPSFAGIIESEPGSRSNDVKVATMNSGDILVHTNETCGEGGLGGFEVYNADDPRNPVHLATVRIDEPNEVLRTEFGAVNRGVHNLFLFTQGTRDYVALATHGNAWFGSTQIYEITDPANPQFVSAWGPELLCEEDFCSDDPYNETDPDVLVDHINWWVLGDPEGPTPGFGSSTIRSVHDITVTDDGNLMYAAGWDAGLVLLDISDPANPEVVSIALDPENGSLDGEVNSHSMWPSEDGTIVVEGEEDFAAWVTVQPPGSLTFGEGDPAAPLPGTAVSTSAGDDIEASQTGNAGTVDADSLEVTSGPLAGSTYPAVELAGDQPKFDDVGPVSGDIVWIGRACDGDEVLNADAIADGGIAVVRRGECPFRDKNFNADAAGADAVVIANHLTDDTPWGGLRIWDYSDPENPELASTFDTECSASPTPIPECDPLGTYSVHNVIVETNDDGRVKAYVSWYWDGMFVLDVTDPGSPTQTARYFDNSEEFLESNGGNPHDFWGVDKIPDQPWIYGSDRNGGLYVFQERGRGASG
ncbi:LVIVD repeat-containing protein, partial [Phytoactinopolyspora endophytica]|uniref:LVIVD repeat-containing protein n=1 Tax=Phytoactinopolyspora endophytica TaxID=1642495 RepID=UPI0013ED608A